MSDLTIQRHNPCQTCGACCNSFRVSFYWAEAESNGLPQALTEKLNPHLLCMAGTNQKSPRCAAHVGEVGRSSACRVYTARPSPCHEVQPGDSQCNKARQIHNLAPIEAMRCLQATPA